jgi:hypothetical protein
VAERQQLEAALDYVREGDSFTVTAHSSDRERPIRWIMNTDSGDHEHPLALA